MKMYYINLNQDVKNLIDQTKLNPKPTRNWIIYLIRKKYRYNSKVDNGCIFEGNFVEDLDINLQKRDETMLSNASYRNNVKCVGMLIKLGASIDIKDKGGGTALMAACFRGNSQCVKLLIDAGADVNVENNRGLTALTISSNEAFDSEFEKYECVKLLVEAGADSTTGPNSALFLASKNGFLETVKCFIKAGADINSQDFDGKTPLMVSALGGNVDVLKELIEAGADLDIQNNRGYTALMEYINYQNYGGGDSVEGIIILVKAGALLNVQYDCVEHNALDSISCMSQGFSKEDVLMLIEVFIEYDASIYIQDYFGNTVIINLCKEKMDFEEYDTMILTFLEKFSSHPDWLNSINIQNKNGCTALMEACRNGYRKVSNFLIDSGANINHKNKYGETALILASQNGDLIEGLYECLIDECDDYEKTALMYATEFGHYNVVCKLLEHSAKPNIQDDRGYTALIYAAKHGHLECMKTLIEYKADYLIEDKRENSAYLWACMHKHKECENFLCFSDDYNDFLGFSDDFDSPLD